MDTLVCLGEPLHLGKGSLRLGEPRDETLACHGQVGVGFVTRFVMFVACFGGHCVTCLEVSLLD